MSKYKNQTSQPTATIEPVRQSLHNLILSHLSEWVPQLVDSEIEEALGRRRYEHHADETAIRHRNGFHKERSLTCGCGTFGVRLPRLRQPFESQIVQRYERTTEEIGQLLPELYLHGLSLGDFRPALELLLGSDAPLSPATIVRLKKQWEQEYQQWRSRKLDADYLYVWADGVYPKAGPKDETMAILVVVGLNRNGYKEILAIEEGYRESEQSWRDVFKGLKKRGVQWFGLTIGDGIDGLWKAVRDIYPLSKHQRCWVHKMRNVVDKVPQHAHDEVLSALQDIYYAKSKDRAMELKRAFIVRFEKLYPNAMKSLREAGTSLFSYFDFPKQHWMSIKSTNVIESIFSTVKLRTNAARRIPKRESALYLVFKLLTTQEMRLNRFRGYTLVAQTIDNLKLSQKSNLRKAA